MDQLTPQAPAESEPQQALARARTAARLLDRVVGIPGSDLGIGLDAILGAVVPGLGDAAAAIVALYVIVQAVKAKVPAVVIARMLVHVGLDALLGLIPVLGDAVDVFYQANLRNVRLIERHTGGAASTRGDLLFVALAAVFTGLALALPWAMLVFLGRWLGALGQ